MSAEPHCPECKALIIAPKERLMPDGVKEYRCPSCSFQIPLLAPGSHCDESCSQCGADAARNETSFGIDQSGLLNLLLCGACGCVLGRYWGLIRL